MAEYLTKHGTLLCYESPRTEPTDGKFDPYGGRACLRVKIKSLAEEARIIRREERKARYGRERLHLHRVGIVRSEARHAQLAYGMLRGRSYKSLEPNAKEPPNARRIAELVAKYGRRRSCYFIGDDEKQLAANSVRDWLSA